MRNKGFTMFMAGTTALLLIACGDNDSEVESEPAAGEPDGAEEQLSSEATEPNEAPAPSEPVDGFVIVDGQEMPLAEIRCGPVGGGQTWRVAASFDIPTTDGRIGRYYFDVRSQIDEDGNPTPVTRLGQPDVTLQHPREDSPRENDYLFLTADSRFRGGNTLDLDFSSSGSKGTIDVQRQYVQRHEVAEEGDEPELKTVEYELNCP